MASSKTIFGLKPVELVVIGGVGYLIYTGALQKILNGVGNAVQGTGQGFSDLAQGVGAGGGQAALGLGSGISDAGAGLGFGIGEVGIGAGNAALGAGNFVGQAFNEAAQATSDLRQAIAPSGKNLSVAAAQATGILADAGSGTRDIFGDLGTRLQRGIDISLRTANNIGTQAFNADTKALSVAAHKVNTLLTNPGGVAQNVVSSVFKAVSGPLLNTNSAPSPRPVAPPLTSVTQGYTAAQASYNPNKAIAALAAKEVANAAKVSLAAVQKPAAQSGTTASSSQPKSIAVKASPIYNPKGYKVVVINGLTRTVKV